jgi:hypothetical protein
MPNADHVEFRRRANEARDDRHLRPRERRVGVLYTAFEETQPQTWQEMYLKSLRNLHGCSVRVQRGRRNQPRKDTSTTSEGEAKREKR